VPQNQMATLLALLDKAGTLERGHRFGRTHGREPGQASVGLCT
jgi:hypothetical protein